MGSLLAVYDPTGRLGLTDPSPGGGSVPVVYRASHNHPWRVEASDALDDLFGTSTGTSTADPLPRPSDASQWSQALLLRTEDGTPDPVGMARAREVLARVFEMDPSNGVMLWYLGGWQLHIGFRQRAFRPLPNESAPEALARLLAEHAGVEVVRG